MFKKTGVKPSINQIELHPYFNQARQREWHEQNQVQTQSWSPLTRANDMLQDNVIKQIAKNHNKTVSPVILRWIIN
ncbi:hypothetical protein GCM10026983_18700 [Gracilibacillus alcaliphilus]